MLIANSITRQNDDRKVHQQIEDWEIKLGAYMPTSTTLSCSTTCVDVHLAISYPPCVTTTHHTRYDSAIYILFFFHFLVCRFHLVQEKNKFFFVHSLLLSIKEQIATPTNCSYVQTSFRLGWVRFWRYECCVSTTSLVSVNINNSSEHARRSTYPEKNQKLQYRR